LCAGWVRKAFPTTAFPPAGMNGKKLFLSPRRELADEMCRELMRCVVSQKP